MFKPKITSPGCDGRCAICRLTHSSNWSTLFCNAWHALRHCQIWMFQNWLGSSIFTRKYSGTRFVSHDFQYSFDQRWANGITFIFRRFNFLVKKENDNQTSGEDGTVWSSLLSTAFIIFNLFSTYFLWYKIGLLRRQSCSKAKYVYENSSTYNHFLGVGQCISSIRENVSDRNKS